MTKAIIRKFTAQRTTLTSSGKRRPYLAPRRPPVGRPGGTMRDNRIADQEDRRTGGIRRSNRDGVAVFRIGGAAKRPTLFNKGREADAVLGSEEAPRRQAFRKNRIAEQSDCRPMGLAEQ